MSRGVRPRVCLFVGPSLSAADVEGALGAADAEVTVRPPVEQGDILRLIEELPDVIGIIDGQFFHAPAVLHREILLALERGARVLGAASIGALRAAELDAFGMEGIGTIYRLYRTGAIDADAEVAVLHAAPVDGFRPLTEALVTIRHNLRRARRRRVISAQTATRALATLKRLHFTRRTSGAVLAAVPGRERPALARFLAREAVDLKREDALRILRTIARRIGGQAAGPPRVRVRVNETSLFQYYRREYVGRGLEGRHVTDEIVLDFQRVLSPSFPALYRRVALRGLALDEAAHRGLAPESAATLLARFRRGRGLGTPAALRTWARRRCLSETELIQALREGDLEARLVARYRRRHPSSGRPALLGRVAADVAARRGVSTRVLTRPLLVHPGVPWSEGIIRELKLRGEFRPALGVASRILRHNAAVFARHPWLAEAPVRRGLLTELLAGRWGVPLERLDAALHARGLPGYDDVVEAARHVFVYGRTSAGPVRPERLTDCFHVDADDAGA
jgi:hypothetical protein